MARLQQVGIEECVCVCVRERYRERACVSVLCVLRGGGREWCGEK